MDGAVSRWQIISKDPESSARFYSSVFGWTIDSNNPLGYRELSAKDKGGIDGGIWPCPPEGRPMVQLFVETSDLEATLRRATKFGAQVIIPPQLLPQGERMSVLVDPEGIPFGLFQRTAK